MVVPLVTAPYLSRVLGAEGLGVYAYLYSVAQYFVYFGILGIYSYGNRGIAKVRDNIQERNYFFSSVYTLQLITSLVAIVAYIIYCSVFIHQNQATAYLLSLFVFSVVFDINWFFWGIENFKVTVTRQIVVKIGTTIGIFIFVRTPSDLCKYTLILSIGTFLSNFYLFLYMNKYVSIKLVNFSKAFVHYKAIFILAIPIIATSIYRVMDKIMIGILCNTREVGYYEYSDKLIATSMGIIGALGSVMLPKMANLVSKGAAKEQKRYLIKSMEFTMFLSCAISFGFFSISDVFIPFFYGEDFLPCIKITKILCFSVPFIAWANVVRMQYLIPNEKDKTYVCSIILGAFFNIITNYILIPYYGAYGAAIGTVLAEALVMLTQTIISVKELPLGSFLKVSIPYLFIGIAMFISARLLLNLFNYTIKGMITTIILSGLFYLFLSFVYFLVTRCRLRLSGNYVCFRNKDRNQD